MHIGVAYEDDIKYSILKCNSDYYVKLFEKSLKYGLETKKGNIFCKKNKRNNYESINE